MQCLPNKQRTKDKKGVVYEIPCKEVYVGETKRTLKVRLSEHRQAVKQGDPKNGIAVHVQKTDHECHHVMYVQCALLFPVPPPSQLKDLKLTGGAADGWMLY